MSSYLCVKIRCDDDYKDILIAELSQYEYDSMQENQNGLDAYIIEKKFNEELLFQLIHKYKEANISFKIENVLNKNWNKEWEKNFDPITIDNQVLIRAHFHKPQPEYKFELVITPKMSFGTGHHATTYLMIDNILNEDLTNKKVLDAGCGTGILSIMSEKKGGKNIVAYDIDKWCIDNTNENILANNCKNITVQLGTIKTLSVKESYDLILANINKNILLEEISLYSKILCNSGKLMISGFYTKDNQALIDKASDYNLKLYGLKEQQDWSSIIFIKSL